MVFQLTEVLESPSMDKLYSLLSVMLVEEAKNSVSSVHVSSMSVRVVDSPTSMETHSDPLAFTVLLTILLHSFILHLLDGLWTEHQSTAVICQLMHQDLMLLLMTVVDILMAHMDIITTPRLFQLTQPMLSQDIPPESTMLCSHQESTSVGKVI